MSIHQARKPQNTREKNQEEKEDKAAAEKGREASQISSIPNEPPTGAANANQN